MAEEEQKTFAKYTEWVDDKTKELGFEIKTATNDIAELSAFIEKADSDVAREFDICCHWLSYLPPCVRFYDWIMRGVSAMPMDMV